MIESPNPAKQWHSIPPPEMFEVLASSAPGLTREEANSRLIKYGRNELSQEDSSSFWTALKGQFASIVIWLLFFAAVVAAVMGEIVDSAAILVIIILNGLLGAYQEHSAERAISA